MAKAETHRLYAFERFRLYVYQVYMNVEYIMFELGSSCDDSHTNEH